ncbi:hypothetical protein [Rubrivirga sp.]|uniref:hypothetical protein n=1 Tax=Rubrivirga sp. TaxID=1885344 RepID=UPI003C776B09
MTRFVLVLLIAWGSTAAAQHHDEEDRPPFELRQPQPGDGPLSVYLRLLEAADRFEPQTGSDSFVKGQLAQYAGKLGLHREALRWDGLAYGHVISDSVGVLPPGTSALDAANEIVRRAEDRRVVMVNEAHHDASSRLLTFDLLEPLYDQGFRYLAAETFAPDSILSAVTDYPTVGMGYYTNEPVFGALVRKALRLGYTLVRYEQDREDPEIDSLDYGQNREYWQARHLKERVFDLDADARLLVHAGYGHIHESPSEHSTPMGWYLRELTGTDPLTVSQTEVWAASTPEHRHPAVRAALEAGLLTDRPVVLEAGGEPVTVSHREIPVDLVVIRPPTSRPVATLGYGALRSLPLPDACGPCVVEVRRSDEGPDAVPVDRVAVGYAGLPALEGGTVEMLGPRDVPLVVTVLDGTSDRVLDRRIAVAR